MSLLNLGFGNKITNDNQPPNFATFLRESCGFFLNNFTEFFFSSLSESVRSSENVHLPFRYVFFFQTNLDKTSKTDVFFSIFTEFRRRFPLAKKNRESFLFLLLGQRDINKKVAKKKKKERDEE